MPLNEGLMLSEVRASLDRGECPKCRIRLRVLLGREWAACSCCGVDYAKGDDGPRATILSRYLPDGHPHCQHYAASAELRNGPRITRIEPFGRLSDQRWP
jgi:hypothetical protein